MGARIRAARYAANLSLREVAEAAGMSLGAVVGWERYGYVPPDHARAALAALYGYPEAELFAEYHARRDAGAALLPKRPAVA